MSTKRLYPFIGLLSFAVVGCGGGTTTNGTMDLASPPHVDGGGNVDMTPPPMTCGDGKKDGNETDVDCGGSCPACADGKSCGVAGDCTSAVCTGGLCAKASCTDGAKNGDETDVDCGGSCPKCSGGKGCKVPTDCSTNMCNAGRCAAGPLMLGMPATFPLGTSPFGIIAVDVNNDKKIDLAVSGSDGLEILLGKGDGTFGAFAVYGKPLMSNYPGDLAAADFNKDGNVDIVWTDFNDNLAYVSLGKGDGTFGDAKQVNVSGGPGAVAVGDFDGDGRPDVAMALAVSNAVAVMTGNGDGTFGAPASYPSGGTNAGCVGALDLDGDGKPDLVVGNTGLSWMNGMVLMPGSVFSLLNTGTGTFKAATKLFDANQPFVLTTSDFNGDGKPDFAITDYGAQTMLVSLDGAMPTSYAGGKLPLGIATADFNLDGKPDIVISNSEVNQVTVFQNTGGGMFDKGTPLLLSYPNPGRLTTGDFNGDGKPDIAMINFNADNMMMILPIAMVMLNTTM